MIDPRDREDRKKTNTKKLRRQEGAHNLRTEGVTRRNAWNLDPFLRPKEKVESPEVDLGRLCHGSVHAFAAVRGRVHALCRAERAFHLDGRFFFLERHFRAAPRSGKACGFSDKTRGRPGQAFFLPKRSARVTGPVRLSLGSAVRSSGPAAVLSRLPGFGRRRLHRRRRRAPRVARAAASALRGNL